MQPRNPVAPRVGRALGRGAGALVVGTALAFAAGLLAPVQAAPAAGPESTSPDQVTMVQANIYSGLTVPRFQADVRKVLDLRPDFITYNEVPLRNDLVMAPPAENYAIHRLMRNRYTAATAVAWRTDRWTMVDSGTFRISNYRGKPPGRKIELGRRFANWVTLTSAEGRTLSVVSAHVAPVTRGMPDLRRRSVRKLGELVGTLSRSGPVLVGGDFNVHYKSGVYPRDLLSAAGMVPTYDMLGTYFPTGDHQGATIDYVFNRGTDQLWAHDHRAMELNSDHDAVIANLSWQVDAPSETQTLSSDPDDATMRRAAVRTIRGHGRDAEPGAVVEVATRTFDQGALYRRLRDAVQRGVHVRLTTLSAELTPRERRLTRVVAEQADPDSWVRQCLDTCRDAYQDSGVPAGLVQVSDAARHWVVRVDTNRPISTELVQQSTTVTTYTGRYALAEGEQLLAGLH